MQGIQKHVFRVGVQCETSSRRVGPLLREGWAPQNTAQGPACQSRRGPTQRGLCPVGEHAMTHTHSFPAAPSW